MSFMQCLLPKPCADAAAARAFQQHGGGHEHGFGFPDFKAVAHADEDHCLAKAAGLNQVLSERHASVAIQCQGRGTGEQRCRKIILVIGERVKHLFDGGLEHLDIAVAAALNAGLGEVLKAIDAVKGLAFQRLAECRRHRNPAFLVDLVLIGRDEQRHCKAP